MQIIPLRPVPFQNLTIVLDGGNYLISVRQLDTGLYLSTTGIDNALCLDRNPIGRFVFFDLEGTSDPYYSGLGTRFKLGYRNG